MAFYSLWLQLFMFVSKETGRRERREREGREERGERDMK
jgi:hypothetical protein